MLRSAEVDALLNQTILIPQSGAKCHEKAIRGNHPVSSQSHYQCLMLLILSVRIILSISNRKMGKWQIELISYSNTFFH